MDRMSSSGSWKTAKMELDRLAFGRKRPMEDRKLVLRLVCGAGDRRIAGCRFLTRLYVSLAGNIGVFSPWWFMILYQRVHRTRVGGEGRRCGYAL